MLQSAEITKSLEMADSAVALLSQFNYAALVDSHTNGTLQQAVTCVTLTLKKAFRTLNGFTDPIPVSVEEAKEEEDTGSEWDPQSAATQIAASRCRALFIEIIRRAAHDWVLYRSSSRLPLRTLAHEAYTWLFEESDKHPHWKERVGHAKEWTSFYAICDLLDWDPTETRETIKTMTPYSIIYAGRPPETRKIPKQEEVNYDMLSMSVKVELDTLDKEGDHDSYYESYYATYTPGYV